MSDAENKMPDQDGQESTGAEPSSENGPGEESAEVAEAEVAEPSPLEQMRSERDRFKDQLLRSAADFDNFRKRARKDVEQSERRGKEDVIRELLPVFDNLERAIQAGSGTTDVNAILQGIDMVLKLFQDTAARLGLERVESVGQRFDPTLHDAFQQVPTDEHPPGTIIAEYQAGYRLGDRLVRPAMVVVSKKPDEPKGQDG